MATNNGYSGTLVPRIGYTRSVCFRNRVRRSFGQSGAVLGVFLCLIFAVPGNGYLTTGYTRSWLFPLFLLIFPFNICYLFVAFVSEAGFGLKKASNWLGSLTKKDCRENTPSSTIDWTGVIHIVRVLWRFRLGVYPAGEIGGLEMLWFLLNKKQKMDVLNSNNEQTQNTMPGIAP